MKKTTERVIVYKEHVNNFGEVYNRVEIAQFKSMHWAKLIFSALKVDTRSEYFTKNDRYCVEQGDEVFYIIKAED